MPIRPFALERYFAEHEFSAELLLCSSDVEAYALRELLALADDETRALWEELTLGYTETAGHPLLRAEIAALYPGLEADDVLVFAGAQEAIFAFAQAALGADDHAVVVTPAYQSLHEVARAAGAEVSTVELEHESGWALDLDDVRRALRPDTSAIVVNFPHNPTGAHIDRATLDGARGDRRGGRRAPLLRRGLPLARAPAAALLPGAAELSARALSLGVMSKTFALPGLRIGWLACRDRELLARIAAIKDYTTICSSAPSEILALIALRRRDDGRGPQPRHRRRQPARCWTSSSRAGRASSNGSARAARRSASRGCWRHVRSTTSRASWSPRRACSCSPARSTSTRATTSASASGGATCPRRSRAWSASRARASSATRRCASAARPRSTARARARRARRDRAWW